MAALILLYSLIVSPQQRMLLHCSDIYWSLTHSLWDTRSLQWIEYLSNPSLALGAASGAANLMALDGFSCPLVCAQSLTLGFRPCQQNATHLPTLRKNRAHHVVNPWILIALGNVTLPLLHLYLSPSFHDVYKNALMWILPFTVKAHL